MCMAELFPMMSGPKGEKSVPHYIPLRGLEDSVLKTPLTLHIHTRVPASALP